MRRLCIWFMALITSAGIGCVLVQPGLTADWNPLPDTGLTECYGVDRNIITCPGSGQPLHGQDAQYRGPTQSYRDNGNGTVTDLNTGLMWQQSDNGTTYDWNGAVDYCNDLSFGGHSDWQLPSQFELESIIDYNRHDLAINPIFSCSDFVCCHWSATSSAAYPTEVFGVSFQTGQMEIIAKNVNSCSFNFNIPMLVRCVRD